MDIVKMLTISTTHITGDTAFDLDKRHPWEIPDWASCFSIYNKEEYGWFITDWDLSRASDIPLDLLGCFRLAERNGCAWLCLDCDGDIVDCLPTYDWE